MAVQCEGDCWIVERSGERKDFEAELNRLAFRPEDFELHVRRAGVGPGNLTWSSHYAVRVSNVAAGKRNIYWGGPGENWVAQFVVDAAKGFFGDPVPKFPKRWPSSSARNPRRSMA